MDAPKLLHTAAIANVVTKHEYVVNVAWRDNGIESRRLEAKDLWLLSFRT